MPTWSGEISQQRKHQRASGSLGSSRQKFQRAAAAAPRDRVFSQRGASQGSSIPSPLIWPPNLIAVLHVSSHVRPTTAGLFPSRGSRCPLMRKRRRTLLPFSPPTLLPLPAPLCQSAVLSHEALRSAAPPPNHLHNLRVVISGCLLSGPLGARRRLWCRGSRLLLLEAEKSKICFNKWD